MIKKQINPPRNWSYWTEDKIKELEKFRVWTIHLPPEHQMSFHKHSLPYFWTALSKGHSRSYFDDGSVSETYYEVGSTKDFPDLGDDNYFIHSLENIGNTTLIFTTVEFLDL